VPGTRSSTPPSIQAEQVSIQANWCSLNLGDSKDAVIAKMGQPYGHKADSYQSLLGPGMTTAEWDAGNDIFLATFTNGSATNLQAYDHDIGPIGARDISCQPFRHR
jgi:hypothetical protein